jgi:plastocyanin
MRVIGKVRAIGLAFALAVLVVLPVAVHSLRAAPMSGTVYVNISPGGTMAKGMASLTFGYAPAVVTVKPGTTVVWTNKSILPEPHFVTFLTPDPKTGAMQGGPPFLTARPKAGKEGSKNPMDMEFVENPLYVLPSEVTGAPFRNSGYLWPERMGPPGGQASWKVTFTNQDAGKTLVYTCVIHPWMSGEVIVTK